MWDVNRKSRGPRPSPASCPGCAVDPRRILAARAAEPVNAELRPWVYPLTARLDPYAKRASPLLAGGVVLVFLVLCANVCSLLLARLTTRRREFSMRAAWVRRAPV